MLTPTPPSMTRSRPDHRPAILAALTERGPLRLAQLVHIIKPFNKRDVDYDLRCLRIEGAIITANGLWSLA
jgi:hypothetical protein